MEALLDPDWTLIHVTASVRRECKGSQRKAPRNFWGSRLQFEYECGESMPVLRLARFIR
jgi:hypothetical protein